MCDIAHIGLLKVEPQSTWAADLVALLVAPESALSSIISSVLFTQNFQYKYSRYGLQKEIIISELLLEENYQMPVDVHGTFEACSPSALHAKIISWRETLSIISRKERKGT
ncbi:hypothetical protein MUK42_34199 [Musa troglodytarum]|uniref:Uncharacterized protein n=1 Tax=Musa troglodytarum TaxID=320322 RepID=A0A9E7GBU2_9LILI|nr:hypothetical protein MUK42_34199 [Musa troglodytarum]